MIPKQYPDWQGRRATKSIFSAIAGGLWLVALALPAYTDDTPGLGAFIFGWMLVFEGETPGFIGWLANIPFIIGIFLFIFGRRRSVVQAAMILSIIAVVFSFGAFTVDEIPNIIAHSNVSPSLGCYTWVIANHIFMVGTVIYMTRMAMTQKINA